MLKAIIIGSIMTLSTAVFAHDSNTCAVAYQGEYFTGESLTISEGQSIDNLRDYRMNTFEYNDWNNKISSIKVKRGCHLIGYQYDNYGRHVRTGRAIGTYQAYYRGYHKTLGYMDNLISSLTCECR